MRLLIFDTETTGLPKTREPAIKGADNWPHLVSIAWVVVEDNTVLKSEYHIIRPQWEIPADSTKIHGITHEKAIAEGEHLSDVILKFIEEPHDIMVAHNMNFDFNVLINAIMWDLRLTVYPDFKKRFCTMEGSRNILRIPFANGRGYKSPKLVELYEFVMKKPASPTELHNSLYDAQLLAEIVMRSTTLRLIMGLPAVPRQIHNAHQKGSTLFL
jgi:hypothetical protein